MVGLQTHDVGCDCRLVQKLRACSRFDEYRDPEAVDVILCAKAIVAEIRLECWIVEETEVELEMSGIGDAEEEEIQAGGL